MARRITEPNNEFGRQLEKERDNRGLSKEQWAGLLGIRKQTYLGWLTGSEPEIGNIREVANVLELTSVEVFAWIEADRGKGVYLSSFGLATAAA